MAKKARADMVSISAGPIPRGLPRKEFRLGCSIPRSLLRGCSLIGLSKAIDQAVAFAAKRQDVTFEPGTVALNWEIFGRRIKATRDFNAAMTVATEITKSLKVDGIKPQPMVSKFGGDILVGFLEKGLLPRQLG